MRMIGTFCSALSRDERGAVAIEYAFLAALVALAIVVSVGAVGSAVADLFAEPELLDALAVDG